MRNLVLVLGDQLNANSAAFDDFDKKSDAVWMAEVAEESTHVWSHKARIALFLSAMRHFRDALRKRNIVVHYRQLDDRGNRKTLAAALQAAVRNHAPQRLIVVQPGEWRVLEQLRETARAVEVPLEVRDDRHFFSTPAQFAEHASGRKQLRLEYYYRELRRQTGVLMDGDAPVGGKWNYDAENRGSFPRAGPGELPRVKRFRPDATTREVLDLVERKFAKHPGRLEQFDWPVTPRQATAALADFIERRLPQFGEYQDAMWTDEPYLFHARISAALNLKLLDPRDVVAAAEAAYRAGRAPLNAVEGFIRQVLGWREYVRGIYWLYMPGYLDRNTLRAKVPLPEFFWTGDTEMNCLRQAITQTLDHGYAHHIQRLMVTGLFCLLLGVDPREVHQWYLAIYVDAVEWVELPNSLGMSQFADEGVMASKPYCATGKYIDRMSNYCRGCQFDPALAVGERACPFTTLYWDFLARHEKRLRGNNRMSMQLKNLTRKSADELREIRKTAQELRQQWS
ncbi:MAG: cryptochrome/photolyase family protein [Planctomycetota bacterium]|nr:MAG: cryptochrome/photolyase family protein [Planctomycetota bacterium]REK40179.1 MAG: cryptochrome/photolyase family protein [Planctomycetota bacterium]